MRPRFVAACVLSDFDGRILLLNRRGPSPYRWQLPGGKVERGEGSAGAALREVWEELGVLARIEHRIGKAAMAAGGRLIVCTWYAATITEGQPTLREPEVHSEMRYFSRADLREHRADLSLGAGALLKFMDRHDV
jgi:8-oxo-dGTP pyrophosphatase MutT (NUDIX family)